MSARDLNTWKLIAGTDGNQFDGQVAQLVEQWTENPCVGGSSPPLTTLLAGQARARAGISCWSS